MFAVTARVGVVELRGKTMAAEPEKYLNEGAASDLLRVSPRTLQRWRNTGGGPRFARLRARRIAYRASDVETWAGSRAFTSRADELSRRPPPELGNSPRL